MIKMLLEENVNYFLTDPPKQISKKAYHIN